MTPIIFYTKFILTAIHYGYSSPINNLGKSIFYTALGVGSTFLCLFNSRRVGSQGFYLNDSRGLYLLLDLIPLSMKTFKSKLREVTAVYRTSDVVPNAKISQSKDVADYIRQVYPVEINIREAMVVLFLNNSNRTLGWSIASIGGITGTLVDVRLILRDALLTQATSIILIHNHPSGTLNPSQADIAITEKVKKAAQLMEVTLLDHIILNEDAYYSFADEGRL